MLCYHPLASGCWHAGLLSSNQATLFLSLTDYNIMQKTHLNFSFLSSLVVCYVMESNLCYACQGSCYRSSSISWVSSSKETGLVLAETLTCQTHFLLGLPFYSSDCSQTYLDWFGDSLDHMILGKRSKKFPTRTP